MIGENREHYQKRACHDKKNCYFINIIDHVFTNADGKILWNDKDGIQFRENSLIAQHIKNDHDIQGPEQVAKINQDVQNCNSQCHFNIYFVG